MKLFLNIKLIFLITIICASACIPVSQIHAQTIELWSNSATWGGQLPNSSTHVIIPENKTIQFDVQSATVKGITIEKGARLVFQDKNFNLTTGWIVVHGELQIGTEAEKFQSKGTITLVGTDTTENVIPFMGTKGILVHGGVLDLHGKVSNTSWTRLSKTAAKGATSLTLEKNVDWKAGDRIVIASTDYDAHQAEELTITAVNDSTVSFTPALKYEHFGIKQYFDGKELDTRAEVGLLTRHILIEGGLDSEAQGFGGHIMAMKGSVMRIEGVELKRMGQKLGNRGVSGRYPLHYHIPGDVIGSYVKNTSIHNTYNRCITIHGTDRWLLTDNVCYNAIGHMYFFEDGAERYNILERNLGILAKKPVDPLIISDVINGSGPAVFWITNPNNILRNNVAAGSEGSGFWFDLQEAPTGLSSHLNILPRQEPLGEFSGNVAHSMGSFGVLIDFHNPRTSGNSIIDRTIVYKVRRNGFWTEGNGPLFGGGMIEIRNAQIADNPNGILNPGFGRIRNSLFVGESANKGNPKPGERTGHDGRSLPNPSTQGPIYTTAVNYYEGPFGVEDNTFVNYNHHPEKNMYAGAISWKPDLVAGVAFDNYVKNLTFINANQVLYVPQPNITINSNSMNFPSLSFWDLDGTITGKPFSTVSNPHPLMVSSQSTYKNAWNGFINPYPIAMLVASCSGQNCRNTIIREDGAGGHVGPDGRIGVAINKKYKVFRNYTDCNFEITMEHHLEGGWVFIETPYSCSLQKASRISSQGSTTLNAVSSVSAVEGSLGSAYYHDSNAQKLYFKLYQPVTKRYDGIKNDFNYEGIRITGSGTNVVVSPPSYQNPQPWTYTGSDTTSKPGDANGDSKVNGLDYVIWLNHYDTSVNQGASVGDFNKNGKVDGQDYVIWLTNYET